MRRARARITRPAALVVLGLSVAGLGLWLHSIEPPAAAEAADLSYWLDEDDRFDDALAAVDEAAGTGRVDLRRININVGVFAADGEVSTFVTLTARSVPELAPYFRLSVSWNEQITTFVNDGGRVLDAAGLAAFSDSSVVAALRTQLSADLAALQDRYDHSALRARLAGWGWKLCLLVTAGCLLASTRRPAGNAAGTSP